MRKKMSVSFPGQSKLGGLVLLNHKKTGGGETGERERRSLAKLTK